MTDLLCHAHECIARCRQLALHSEEAGGTTRTFLSPPMRQVHADVSGWMRSAGMSTSVDAAGNLRGVHQAPGPTLYIGSHLDTVPQAGAFDGILGVVLAIKMVELAKPRHLRVEAIGFSEEEGVRFGFPFIGSSALTGELDGGMLAREDRQGVSVEAALRNYGLDPAGLPDAVALPDSVGYLEFHIEQGPVLESLGLPLGIVDAINGQTRLAVLFTGRAGHAGTTPMHLRRDSLAAAAEWVLALEAHASDVAGLVATAGRIQAFPGAPNVIAGQTAVTLDVRHCSDNVRQDSVAHLIAVAERIARRRGLRVSSEPLLNQAAAAMDLGLTELLGAAVAGAGQTPHRMSSGAGHDAMVMARRMPAAMLFMRSPGGISHHPDESVLPGDVAAALDTGIRFVNLLEQSL